MGLGLLIRSWDVALVINIHQQWRRASKECENAIECLHNNTNQVFPLTCTRYMRLCYWCNVFHFWFPCSERYREPYPVFNQRLFYHFAYILLHFNLNVKNLLLHYLSHKQR